MAKFNEVRITCADISRHAGMELEQVRRIMAQYEPLDIDEKGEPAYSIAQMMGGMFRGAGNEKTEQ